MRLLRFTVGDSCCGFVSQHNSGNEAREAARSHMRQHLDDNTIHATVFDRMARKSAVNMWVVSRDGRVDEVPREKQYTTLGCRR